MRHTITSHSNNIAVTAVSIVAAILVCYFMYHALEGDHGWFALRRLRIEAIETQEQINNIKAEREKLENRTRRLRDATLDPDVLDEVARQMLGYSKPNELVVITKNQPNPSTAVIKPALPAVSDIAKK